MQINQDFKAISFSPVKGAIQFSNRADKWLAIAKDKVGDRNADQIETGTGNSQKIGFGNKVAAVLRDAGQIFFFAEFLGQLVFIVSVSTIKQMWGHPLFKDQPATQVDAFEFFLFHTKEPPLHLVKRLQSIC